ncbi:MAG: hypothetical protein OXL96_14775 [Candidatus Poribacteria bacterium]|nr:hypothetical protein [Candidatus Poribacteria bacterium]
MRIRYILDAVYRRLGKFTNRINLYLTRKFRESPKLAALVVGGLLSAVVLLVIFLLIKGWIFELRDNEIPSDITYRQPEEVFDPTMQPKLKIENIGFSEEFLDGGDTNELSISIRNDGTDDAGNLTIEIRLSTNPKNLKSEVLFTKSTDVPTIPKEGAVKTVLIDIEGTNRLTNGKVKIKSYLVDSNFNRVIPLQPFTFKTRKLATPKLELGKWVVKEEATGKTEIHLYEDIKLEFSVHNNSNVEAKDVKVQVRNTQAGVILLEKTGNPADNTIISTFEIINKDQPRLVSHIYSTNLKFKDAKLEFKISATEQNSSKYGFDETIKSPINLKIEPQGEVTIGTSDDESPLHEPVKSSGNTLWLIVVYGGLFIIIICVIIIWKRLRRSKQAIPGITTIQSKPSDSDPDQKAAYKAATGRKERFK